MTQAITKHEGHKYLRRIRCCLSPLAVMVDVYKVLIAFNVTCPARAHAVKKLLCCGQRGKGTELDDLIGAQAALYRAIEEQMEKEAGVLDETPRLSEPLSVMTR